MIRYNTIIQTEGAGRSASLGLIPNGKRNVKRIPADLLALVPKPTDNVTVEKGSNPDPIRDTVPLIKKLVRRQLWQGEKLAKRLKGNTVTDTARNYWNFIFDHIQFVMDDEIEITEKSGDKSTGNEVVKSLRKLIHSGSGDCDCFTNSLSNLLLNAGIPHFFRVAKYKSKPNWSHIYIVIPRNKNMATDSTGNMKATDYITLDCVPHQFNYEERFTDHKDFAMKLISLDGLGCACGCESKKESGFQIPRKKVFLSGKQLEQMGMISTKEVLTKAGITVTQDQDDLDSIVAVTPSGGLVKVPDYVEVLKQEKLVSDVRNFTPPTEIQTGTESVTEETLSPKTAQAGGALLGLLALTVGLGSMRSNPTGLSGTPTRGKKRMAVLHM